nr:uncharacterized protein LOC115842896 isoform X2 [Globicephala melas]
MLGTHRRAGSQWPRRRERGGGPGLGGQAQPSGRCRAGQGCGRNQPLTLWQLGKSTQSLHLSFPIREWDACPRPSSDAWGASCRRMGATLLPRSHQLPSEAGETERQAPWEAAPRHPGNPPGRRGNVTGGNRASPPGISGWAPAKAGLIQRGSKVQLLRSR